MNKVKYLILIALFAYEANAESWDEKVARNASHCLIGHMTTESDKYNSGETSQYVFLIENILGSDQALKIIKTSYKKLNSAISLLNSTKKKEGEFLIQKFCPTIDDIIKKQNKV